MLRFIPWNPLRAICLSALRTLVPRLPSPSRNVPVYVMLPLDAAQPDAVITPAALESYLKRLASIDFKGVMFDVWWRICEPNPTEYNFDPYINLFRQCLDAGLSVQAVMSFHACGGNIGDTVNIPLPSWVIEAGDKEGAWYTDRSTGAVTREYLSLGVDHHPFLPAAEDQPLRTPLTCYTDFVKAFTEAVSSAGYSRILTELQIGLGPCGELRYPSYRSADDVWSFPGIGEFQCYDRHLMGALHVAQAGASTKVRDAKLPPTDAGSYKDTAWSARFFRGRRNTSRRWFLDWYSGALLRHADDVLGAVRTVTNQQLALKISGVHWWALHGSRAAEATTGYIGADGPVYTDIARIAARYGAVVDFTCLEMRSWDQPLWARCGPRQLVAEVFDAARRAGVRVAGENALERWDWMAFKQIVRAFRRTRAEACGFTLLRLGDSIPDEGWHNLERFVNEMSEI